MKYLPISIDIHNKQCLVVGGGSIALRKSKTLLSAGAKVLVAAPEIAPEFEELAENNSVQLCYSDYASHLLDNVSLVVAATDELSVNQRISSEARRRDLLVNVVDQPNLCNFVVPSILDRSPLTIAISSSGSAPVFARMLREKLEWLIPDKIASLLGEAGKQRSNIAEKYSSLTERKRYWEKYFSECLNWSAGQSMGGEPLFLIKDSIKDAIEGISAYDDNCESGPQGTIYFIDLGVGEVDYLSVKAVKVLQKIDQVYHDDNLPRAIQKLIRRDAECYRIDSQKTSITYLSNSGSPVFAKIKESAQQGQTVGVLRLKHDYEISFKTNSSAAKLIKTDSKDSYYAEVIKALQV